jgi:hypothetical protein
MKESRKMQGVSRRGFLYGTAGAALAAALPLSRDLTRSGLVAAKPHTVGAHQAARKATAAPLNGATIYPNSYKTSNSLTAAKDADALYGLPLATTIQKVYLGEGQFGTTPGSKVSELAAGGCQFVIDASPLKSRSKAQQTALANWLAMMNQAGINYRVVLWSEGNDVAFPSTSEWLAYWNYYAPVVKDAGVICGYNPGCNHNALPRAIADLQAMTDPVPDELWMDYYATAFIAGSRINNLIATAQAASVPSGLAEWGWYAGTFGPFGMTMPVWNDYCNYLISLAQAGMLQLGTIFYGGVHNTSVDVISSASDPRIPMLQNVCAAVAAQ